MFRRPLVFWTILALAGGAVLLPPAAARAQSPYVWPAGPSGDPNWFPVGVWYQSYSTFRVGEYQSIGLTMYTCPSAPTNANLATLRNAGIDLFTTYRSSLLTLANQGVIKGWIHQDEPDNAQWDSNIGTWGPCVDPNVIIAQYNAWKAADPNRPVFLNLGQGVTWPYDRPYYGRGSGSSWAQYPRYVQGADVVSFDVYPYNSRTTDAPYMNPWYVAVGVDRLRAWTNYQKPVWVFLETTNIRAGDGPGPTWRQTKAETWMALIHGAMGVQWFAHSWHPAFKEDAIFSTDPNTVDPNMPGALAALSAQILSLAPVLYSPTEANYLDPNGNVNWVVKEYKGETYLFASALRELTSLSWTFQLADMPSSIQAEVLGEGRSVTLANGTFTDNFANLGVHLYKIPIPEPASAAAVLCGSWLVLRSGRRRGIGHHRDIGG